MRKPAFCICQNKDPDQLCGNREADQRLCFRYTDGTIPLLPNSTIPLLPKSEISSLLLSSVAVQPGLCQTRSKTSQQGSIRMQDFTLAAITAAENGALILDSHKIMTKKGET